jgi:hypothetical protein
MSLPGIGDAPGKASSVRDRRTVFAHTETAALTVSQFSPFMPLSKLQEATEASSKGIVASRGPECEPDSSRLSENLAGGSGAGYNHRVIVQENYREKDITSISRGT